MELLAGVVQELGTRIEKELLIDGFAKTPEYLAKNYANADAQWDS